MASNGNFCTWLPTHYQGGSGSTTTFSFGNCRVGTTSGGYPLQISNFAFPRSGKWYIELNNIVNNGYHCFGIIRQENMLYGNYLLDGTGAYQYQGWNGQKRGNGGSASSYGSSFGSVGDVIGLAFDSDNGKIWWAKNGTWQGSGDPAGNSNEAFSGLDAKDDYYFGWSDYYTSNPGTVHINCGQDSSFGNSKTSGSANAADDNGFGDFFYAPPSGFLALSSANIPTSSDIDPAQTDSDFPQKQFNTVTFNGNGSTNAVTGLGFQPDLIWGFTRDGSQSKRMVDSSRGGSSRVHSDLSSGASTGTAVISSFDSDGFTANGGQFNNDSGRACGAWCWRANGGTTASNTTGSTTSTVQANTAAGFSIIQYAGNSSSGSTIGHGLNSAPDFILFKALSGSENWAVYHRSLGGTKAMILNTTSSAVTNSNRFNDTDPSATLITMGNVGNVNESGKNYICYAWHSVEGYSTFGSYVGNGNSSGPFMYTGFRPRMLFLKRIDGGHNWVTFDTATVTHNPDDEYANWDTGSASAQSASDKIDILSNGWKIRSTGSSFNFSGATFIYGAWGDVPTKYGNAF